MGEDSKQKCLVSIIITTKNEENNIQNCLESIKNQKYPQDKIEIIVVDNNSNDRTKEIAQQYTNKVYNCGPERSAQRNFGIKQAKGKYILYLDADMILSENVISECVDKCEKENIIALYIPERITGKGFWIKVRDFERGFYNATCVDAVRFVRRDKFLEAGWFDESFFVAEDWDFDRRIKKTGKVGIISSSLSHNEGIFSIKGYLRKKNSYSKKFSKYIEKWGSNDPVVTKQLGFWYRFFGVFTEDNKWEKLIRHPILAVCMYGLRFVIGLTFLLSKLSWRYAQEKYFNNHTHLQS